MNEITVGKDLIELLGSAMYRDPLAVYREYIQNSVDAVDDAIKSGALGSEAESRIEISIDNIERKISIRDNGSGIAQSKFKEKMLSIGGSAKRNSSARGFRGIGRLAGLGFCQELVFTTRTPGQKVCELRWDIRDIKQALSNGDGEEGLLDLIENVTKFQSYDSDDHPDRFFEVQMIKPVRVGGDILMNIDRVTDYLSQVAPVPYSDQFNEASKIKDHLSILGALQEYQIYINNDENALRKPYKSAFPFSETKSGNLTGEVDLIEIEGDDGMIAAGWIAHSDYLGAIPPRALVGGLRARIGNIQIGERDVFVDVFPEQRFNSWTIGEIHIFSQSLVPNGRRDGFEHNKHLSDLNAKLLPHCHDVARQCRKQSSLRNTRKRIESVLNKTNQLIEIIDQGALSVDAIERKKVEARACLFEISSLLDTAEYDLGKRDSLDQQLAKQQSKLDEELRVPTEQSAVDKLSKSERNTVTRLFDLIYDCSSNQTNAKLLIDKILVRL